MFGGRSWRAGGYCIALHWVTRLKVSDKDFARSEPLALEFVADRQHQAKDGILCFDLPKSRKDN